MRHNRKHLDFEINLIPCIDLLSVCICFLLLTAVWLQVGSLNVKQAIGGQSAAETEKTPQLWVSIGDNGQITLNLKQAVRAPAQLRTAVLKGLDGKLDVATLAKTVARLKGAEPELRAALIQPQLQTDYEEIIGLMDEFKRAGLTDLGVVPL